MKNQLAGAEVAGRISRLGGAVAGHCRGDIGLAASRGPESSSDWHLGAADTSTLAVRVQQGISSALFGVLGFDTAGHRDQSLHVPAFPKRQSHIFLGPDIRHQQDVFGPCENRINGWKASRSGFARGKPRRCVWVRCPRQSPNPFFVPAVRYTAIDGDGFCRERIPLGKKLCAVCKTNQVPPTVGRVVRTVSVAFEQGGFIDSPI